MGPRFFFGLKNCAKVAFSVVLLLGCGPILRAHDSAPPPPSNPGQGDTNNGVSFQTFYDSLAKQGTWIQSPDYGYVWQPSVTDSQWAPYTNGHWVYSNDGWTWLSNEPWGWATYHYGRWVNLDGTGWCWVPGYTWGPAWVSWRYGDGYCGWAPLPPDSLVGVDYASGETDFGDGFHIGGDCDDFYGIGAGCYVFLPVVYLGDLDYRGYYANRFNNYRLINRTTNVTNINVNRRERDGHFGGVSLGGPSYLQASARSQAPISRVTLAHTDRVGGGAIEGNTMAIFAPHVDARTQAEARPEGNVDMIARTDVNRGTDLSRPLLVNSHVAALTPTSMEIHEAQAAQAAAPASARLASMSKPVPSGGKSSFTSLRPVESSTAGNGSRTSGTSTRPSSGGTSGYGGAGTYRTSNPNLGSNPSYARPRASYGHPSTANPSGYRSGSAEGYRGQNSGGGQRPSGGQHK